MPSAVNLPAGIPSYEAPANAAAAARNTLGSTSAEIQDNFMKLLLAQIRSQDPLNPQDPAQMTSQLSQLNMVSGLQTLNGTVESMLSQVGSAALFDSAAMIGRSVLLPGDAVALGERGGVDFGVRLQADAAQTTVQVRAADGTLVDEISLGALAAGSHAFTWDGAAYDGARAAAGGYTLRVLASAAGGGGVTAVPLTYGSVSAVQRSGSANVLLTTDGRSVDTSQVVQIKS